MTTISNQPAPIPTKKPDPECPGESSSNMIAPVSLLPLVALAAHASPLDASLYSRQESLNACLEAAGLTYLDDSADSWTDAIEPNNLRVPITPRAIVYPKTTEDIQAAVLCAVENEIKVAAKSGGHSYASMGLGGEDGSLVIQLDGIHEVTLRDDDTAIVTAGTRLGYAALQLYDQGKRGFSHGTCPSVGVGGHVIHGGFGFSSHTHGLALDAVIGANVVLADGSLVHASESENEDLFWAIRGGGSSFGIVTEFEVETFDTSEDFSWFMIGSDLTSRSKEDAVAGLMGFQKVLEDGDMASKLNMRLGVGSTANLEVVYHGPKDEARAALEPFVEPLGLLWKSNRTTSKQGDWIEMLNSWTYGDPLNLTTEYDGHSYAYTSSLVTKHIPESAMSAFVDYWFDVALADDAYPWWAQMDVHGDPASAIVQASDDFSSYAHRDKLWLFQFSASPVNETSTSWDGPIEFVNGYMDSLKDNMDRSDWGRYANYIDSELSREDALEQYFADNLERLREIKGDLDSSDLFYNPQSINP